MTSKPGINSCMIVFILLELDFPLITPQLLPKQYGLVILVSVSSLRNFGKLNPYDSAITLVKNLFSPIKSTEASQGIQGILQY